MKQDSSKKAGEGSRIFPCPAAKRQKEARGSCSRASLPDTVLRYFPRTSFALSTTACVVKPNFSNSTPAGADAPKSGFLNIPGWFIKIILGVVLIIGLGLGLVSWFSYRQRCEAEERKRRRERRLERLKETGFSEAEFNFLVQEQRKKKSASRQKKR